MPEILSAMNRRLREKSISRKEYEIAKSRLLEEIEDIALVNLTPTVIQKSIVLLEKHTLRTLDALHIACATEWQPDLFVSSDQRQIQAAKQSGLSIQLI